MYADELDIKYLKLNIEDHDTVQIKMAFPNAYEFIDKAFSDEGTY